MTKEYKLFNTDKKTFFDFRSNPESRCEGFTLTFCDDGTVVMSGDYGTLCWKRNYHHAEDKEFYRDYGFPSKETGIGYFAEKVCNFGVEQKIEEWSSEKALNSVKEEFKDDERLKEIIDKIEYLEDFEQYKFIEIMNEYDDEPYRTGIRYTEQFKFMFEVLQSVSEQILEVVREKQNEK
jgi:hypothetical protein